MSDTRLRTNEVDLLRLCLPKGYHIDKALLERAAVEYLRLLDLVCLIEDSIAQSARKAGKT